MRRKIPCVLITILVVFAISSGTVVKAAQRTTHGDGTWYSADVINGEVIYGSTFITLSSGMRASVSKDGGAAKSYVSGTLLSEPGQYTMTFISTSGYKETTSQMSFTIKPDVANTDTSKYLPPMYDYGSYDPNLGTGGMVLAGGENAPALGETYEFDTPAVPSMPTVETDPKAGIKITAVATDPVTGAFVEETSPSASPVATSQPDQSATSSEQPTPTSEPPGTAPDQPGLTPSQPPGSTPDQPGPTPGQTGTTPEPYPTSEPYPTLTPYPTPEPYPTPDQPTPAPTPEPTPMATPEPTEIVINIALSSNYYPDFDVYEYTFMSGKYFYANIPNGTITPVGVTLDIPSDISVHVHKDGQHADYKNKEVLVDEGSYVFFLSSYDYNTTPHTRHRAVFRFRIQGKDTFLNDGYGTVPAGSFSSEPLIPPPDETGPAPTSVLPSYEPTPEPTPDMGEPPVGQSPDESQLDEQPDETASHYHAEDDLPFAESYQVMKSMFHIVAPDGSGFYSDVPNGMVTDSAVRLEFPDGMLKAMYRDDESYPFDGASVTEHGSYRCELNGGQSFSFRIITEPVENLRLYYPPYGFSVTSALRDGTSVFEQTERLRFAQDGAYAITIENTDGVSRKLAFTVGAQKPAQEGEISERSKDTPATPGKTVILIIILVVLLAGGGALVFLRKRRQSF